MAVLVGVSTLMVSAGPALVARLDDRALRRSVTSAAEQGLGVSVTVDTLGIDASAAGTPAHAFGGFASQLLAPLPGWARPMLGVPSIDIATPFMPAAAPGLATVGGVAPEVRVEYADQVPGGLRYVAGTAPPVDSPGPSGVVPIAASTATRDVLHLTIGETVALSPGTPGSMPATARVVGFFQPIDTTSPTTAAFWYAHPWLRAPVSGQGPARDGFSPLIQRATVLTSAGGIAAITPTASAAGSVGATITFPLAPAAMTADSAAALSAQLGRMTDPAFDNPCTPASYGMPEQCGPFTVARDGLAIAADVKPTLDRFVTARAEVWVVDSFSLASLATVALITMFSAARLTIGRRERDLVLHRVRGASVRGLMAVRAVHGAVVTVPALVVGWIAARVWLVLGSHGPQSSGPGPGWLLAAINVAGLVLLPGLTWARSRFRSVAADPAVVRRRRLVVEAGVGILAVAAVVSLHSRGISGLRAAGIDPQISLVPVLLGTVGAVVLLRVHPVVLGGSLRWARRRRSAVPVLAFTQARCGPGLGAAGLLVLVLTLAGLVFGGLVTRTVTGAHVDAANEVSGDAVVQGRGLTPAVRAEVGAVAGVQHVIGEEALWTPGGGTSPPVKTIAVDVKALMEADPASRLAHLLTGAGAVPGAALSPSDLRVVSTELGGLSPAGPFLIVPLAAGSDPDTLVIDGPAVSESELRAALPANITYQIQTRRTLTDNLDTSTLTASLALVANACAALASAFALAALVLELLAGARSRGETVSFLRTMGLRSRSATSMLIVQLLPPAFLAALAGAGLGVLIPRLLGSALELRAVTGGAAEPVIRVDFATTVALGSGVVALVLLAALIDSGLARRRRLGSVLRFDSR
ncbi:hypothetical protein KGQ20_05265 [Catenulispora sp. NF23]|uniref:FtsX-like permease family protein n=1 Tax=Catenulispora pinistramenti TaxID=2705254 RepID=UPI001BAAD0F6|nr:FtsX-like permease family protein [Catenulispora pinistramenti]MBS2532176.1 hypothetical protein [Catenulispora pinistramenti]